MTIKRKPRVLMIVPGFIPSTIIGVMRPLAALADRKEIYLRLRLANFSPFLTPDVEWCDIAVFTRNCEIGDLQLLYELKRLGKKVVYDIDDNFEEIPLSSDVAIYHKAFYRLHVVRRFFELSDVVRVYSDRMAERVRLRGKEPQLVRCYFDMKLVEGPAPQRQGDKLKIVYPTGRLDDRQLENMLYSAVAAILKKYAGKVEFHLYRKEAPEKLKGLDGVVLNKPVSGYDNFIRAFYRSGFDIGLAPGVDSPFFRSKTNNKYREFGGCGIAGLYSNFPPYSNTVKDGVAGLLVDSTTEAWINAIERLLNDASLRQNIVAAARVDISTNYTFENELVGWRRAIESALQAEADDMEWMPDYGSWYLATVNLRGRRPVSGEELENGSESSRLGYIRAAASHLPRIGLIDFRDNQVYLASASRRGCGATFYLIDTEQEFEVCLQLLTLSNSAIIDFSCYRGEVLPLIRRLAKSMFGIPLSCIVQASHAPAIRTLDLAMIKIWEVDNIEHEKFPLYSVDGYPAVYVNVIENHIQYAPVRRWTKLMAVQKKWIAIAAIFGKNRRRFVTIWRYFGWRIGRRTF